MIQFDPDERAIHVQFPGGEEIEIGGLPQGVAIENGSQRALFVDQAEADTLGKMIDYILQKVPIKPESQEALKAVRPRLETLFRD